MSSLPSVDLITPCRNRLEYLSSSLPSWLACAQLRRIIIIDFSSTVPVIDGLGGLRGERVTVVRVNDEPLWRQGRAQNIGLGLAEADLVLKIDADVAVLDLNPYLERIKEDAGIFFKGFSKLGSSSGLCLAPRRWMQAVGGYHDHMSGWGGDDVDFYRRLKKRKLKAQVFQGASFREQKQKMAGKNSEAPRLDSNLLSDPQQLASQPYFSNFRNTLLARIQRQNRRRALRWHYSVREENSNLVFAEMKASGDWRLQISRHGIELANILALAFYEKSESVWEFLQSQHYQELVHTHRLPRFRNRRERCALLASLPYHRQSLCQLAQQLGLELISPLPS